MKHKAMYQNNRLTRAALEIANFFMFQIELLILEPSNVKDASLKPIKELDRIVKKVEQQQ
jgi:hypothetical protein